MSIINTILHLFTSEFTKGQFLICCIISVIIVGFAIYGEIKGSMTSPISTVAVMSITIIIVSIFSHVMINQWTPLLLVGITTLAALLVALVATIILTVVKKIFTFD